MVDCWPGQRGVLAVDSYLCVGRGWQGPGRLPASGRLLVEAAGHVDCRQLPVCR